MKIERKFVPLAKGFPPRPYLEVTFINPHTGKDVTVLGLIDTGADECALPAKFAEILGHKLEKGTKKRIETANGETIAYSHAVNIQVDGFMSKNVLIDFMVGLDYPLIGVKSFLGKFVLVVNYPKKAFKLMK